MAPSNEITTRTTSNASQSDLSAFIDLLSQAYVGIPLTTAFIGEIDGTSSPSITPSRLKEHFQLGINAVAKSNILLTFAYSSASPSTPIAAALFEPPSFTGVPPSHARKQPGPILSQYRNLAKSLKSKHLSIPDDGPKSYTTPAAPSQSSAAPSEDPYPADFNKDVDTEIRPIYHLAFCARNTADGIDQFDAFAAIRKIVKEVQDRARQEDVAVWLTTSELRSQTEFRDMGFKVLEEEIIGKGLVGKDGLPKKGGEGVSVWGLLWE